MGKEEEVALKVEIEKMKKREDILLDINAKKEIRMENLSRRQKKGFVAKVLLITFLVGVLGGWWLSIIFWE